MLRFCKFLLFLRSNSSKRKMKIVFDSIIIGAGVSGLMAAIQASKSGRRVLIIDHAEQAGTKALVSGGGKCNITNLHITPDDYYGADNKFCKFALNRYPTAATLQLLQEANIETEERDHGRIFCKNSASEIVSFLVRTAENQDVRFAMNTTVSEVKKDGDSFSIRTGEQLFESERLLIATGGLAWPQLGATGFGYEVAKQFGHTILPLRPALTGFILPHLSPLKNLQGISLDVRLQVKGKNRIIEEPLLFTHQGISGPATFQASCIWEKRNTLLIDFLPSEDMIALMHQPENGRLRVKKLVTNYLPERLVSALIPEQLAGRKVAELSKRDRLIISGNIHQYTVIPDDVEGFNKAEVTLGGIATHELNPKTMESNLIKGLFFSGEVIDITGRLGGYNIHWAFASGYVAGQNL